MKLDLLVPTSLHDIPLKHYQKFIKTFENADDYTEDYAALKMLEIFCGVPYSEAIKFKVGDINRVVSKINEALAEKPSLINRFKLGSTEFGFVPELNDLTFGEFVDIENNIGDWETMHKAMAVLYRPITDRIKGKYQIEKYRGDSWHDAMLNMPSSVAISAINFFFHLENDLLKATLAYSEAQTQELLQDEPTISINNGGGITAL